MLLSSLNVIYSLCVNNTEFDSHNGTATNTDGKARAWTEECYLSSSLWLMDWMHEINELNQWRIIIMMIW